VLGPGRLGSSLLAALLAHGCAVAAVGVSPATAPDPHATPPRLPAPEAVATAAGEAAAAGVPLVLWLTVPDDVIGPVAVQIAEVVAAGTLKPEEAVVVHTSGLGSLSLLQAPAKAGLRTLALHPLQSFKAGAGAGALEDVPVAVTAADDDGLELGRRLAETIGGRPFALPDDARPRYHLAAVVASNLLVALQAEAADLLRQAAGGDQTDALQRLRPLVSTTLDNVYRDGPERALTGPIARGDVGTVRAHLRILDHHAARHAAAYRALSLEALSLAAPRLDDETVQSLQELLGPFPGQAGPEAAGLPFEADVDAAHGKCPAPAGRPTTAAGRTMTKGRRATSRAAAPIHVARTPHEMRALCAALPRPLGFVPTMGALHDGHLELVRHARRRCAAVVASIFVNPTQFGPGEDFDVYPREEVRDLELLRAEGVAVVLVPTATAMYPGGPVTTVHVAGPLAESFEGAARPGHFDGVATVVAKLLAATRPDVLFLGEKDAQQLAVVRGMVRDLDLQVEVAGVPTVREPDGLAMSSRNRRLSPDERRAAPRLHAALRAGVKVASDGGDAGTAIAAVRSALQDGPGEQAFAVDYVALVDPDTFVPLAEARGGGLLIAAARLGAVRLIDNVRLGEDPGPGGLETTDEQSPRPAGASRHRTGGDHPQER
jgi:pantoate--beta-alanine ligase